MGSRITLVQVENADRAVLAHRGGHLGLLAHDGRAVTFAEPTGGNAYPPLTGRTSQLLLRSFMVARGEEELRRETELVYTVENSSVVFRRNLVCNINRPQLHTGLGEITCLSSSQDGRYIAVGDTNGELQVWNFDLDKPHRVCHIVPRDCGAVMSIAFKRTNLELYVAYSNGEYHRIIPSSGECHVLNNGYNWPCYSIACQSEGSAIVFAGDGLRVWFLNPPFVSEPINLETRSPFAIARLQSVTETTILDVQAMPGARVGYLDTGIRWYIQHVVLLSDTELLVVGDSRAELWDLEKQVLIEERDYEEYRLLGAGKHEHDGYVILSRGAHA